MLRTVAYVRASSSRRGAIGRGCLVGLAVVILLGVLGAVGCGQYNSLVDSQENVRARWSEIDNQYRRRFDLIPNLVETVKGAASFERETLEAVVEARASVGRAQLPSELPTDPAQLQQYIQAQQNLSGALSRLFAVVEGYPELRATAGFQSLQDQLEGTENRIAVARRDYIDAVQAYNAQIRRMPARIFAGLFGFEPAAQIEASPEERSTPRVDFGGAEGEGG